MMKKTIICALFAGMLTACGGSKSVQGQQAPASAPATSPFGPTYTMPTFEPDTEEYFAATGTAVGAKERMDVLQRTALTSAQNLVRQKMKHAYMGMISDYANYMGLNASTDVKTKVESGGDQLIDVIVNDTQARAVEFSGVDEKGNVTCFVGIRIYKAQAADKIADQISKDDELKLRFDEEKFRERTRESFKNYKENHQP